MMPSDPRRRAAQLWLDRAVVPGDLLAEAMAIASSEAERGEATGQREVIEDLLLALSIATTDDPAAPWNHAGHHARLGERTVEAGIEFVRAAEYLSRMLKEAPADDLYNDDWRAAAVFAACECFLDAGRPLAAAALYDQLPDGDDKAEVLSRLEAWLQEE